MYDAAAKHILGGTEHMETLRKQTHRFIIQNWEYYHKFIPMPFKETIGVGGKSYEIEKDSYQKMKDFLLSDESLYCYSNSSLDLSNLANMYNMNIATFTYSSSGSVVPHWTWIYPDPVGIEGYQVLEAWLQQEIQ